MIYESDEELQEACQDLQKCLRLNDWNVIAVLKELDDDINGCIDFEEDNRTAVIEINKDKDNHRSTLIHELLHLHFWWVSKKNKVNWHLLEHAIHSIEGFCEGLIKGGTDALLSNEESRDRED